jgi:hypothetical protein
MMNLAAWDISLCAPISPNGNWMNPSNWTKMHHLFRNTFQQVHLSAISSDIGLGLNYINNNLLGSAAILTFGLWSSKISQSFSDNSGMGTFSVTTIQGKDQKLISFISAHIVVKKGTDLGVDSVYAQQQIIYEKKCMSHDANIKDFCPHANAIQRLNDMFQSPQKKSRNCPDD